MTATTAAPVRPPDLATVLPLTGRRRALLAFATAPLGLLALGLVGVAASGRDSAWTGLLSLVAPGLGQLVQGRTGVGVALLVVLVPAVVYAIMRSGGWTLLLLAPSAALDAATSGAGWSVPVGLLASAALVASIETVTRTWRDRRILAFERARAATAPVSADTPAHVAPVASAPPPALDHATEAYLRHFLRFGHAAPDDWSVFDDPKHVDSALRYQLVLAAWSLYHFQYQHTPAYREAAGTALTNLAERGRSHRAWDYVVRENLKGLRYDPDPFERENVMYSGYIANVIGMQRAMTGDDRYDQPGGYAVTDGRRTYDWDHTSIVDQLALQHAISPFGSITCFPGWLFPPCQTFSLRAIQLYDLVTGADHGYAVERYLEAYRRWFVDDRGKVATCRHVVGFRHPIDPLVVGVTGQAASGLFAAAFEPSVAEATYVHQVRSRMRPADEDGRIALDLGRFDTYDTSYGWNPGMPYSFALLHAAEMGDTEAAAGIRRTLDDMLTPDGDRPGPGSLVSMAVTFMALTNSERAVAAGHRHAPCLDTGPELAHAPYPDVIVTEAREREDGVTCELVPGPDASTPVALAFARLRGDTEHVVLRDGVRTDRVTTDDTGRLEVVHDATTRARIDVLPVA